MLLFDGSAIGYVGISSKREPPRAKPVASTGQARGIFGSRQRNCNHSKEPGGPDAATELVLAKTSDFNGERVDAKGLHISPNPQWRV